MATDDTFGNANANNADTIKKLWTIDRTDLVKPDNRNEKDLASINDINLGKLQSVIENTSTTVNDAKGIMEILPDLALVEEILISSILSPKDLSVPSLIIGLHNEAPNGMAELIKEHFTTHFDLDSKLHKILAKSLFQEGAYPLLILPPKVISNMIVDNTIALDSIGTADITPYYIGNTDDFSMDGLGLNDKVKKDTIMGKLSFTDDISVLSTQYITELISENNAAEFMMDAFGYGAEQPKEESIYLKRKTKSIATQELVFDENDTDSNMNPVVMELPMESVIPVITPGEPEHHTGYLVLVDEGGSPINRGKDSNYFKELNLRLEALVNSTGNKPIGTVTTTAVVSGSSNVSVSRDVVKPLVNLYMAKFEKEIRDSIKNTTGKIVEVKAPESLYRIMLSRQLSNQGTKVVYVPKELLTYVAFDYNEFGIGVSLLEKTKLYASLRAIILFSTILADVRGSVPTKKLTITLDEMDKDPQKTIETIVTEFARLQGGELPIGQLSPYDIISGIQKAGIQVVIDGGEVFPGTAVELDEEARDINKPDEDMADALKRAHYSGLWVAPEHVDRSLEGDFATGIVSADLIATKRHMKVQREYMALISTFIKSYIRAGGPLRNAMQELFDKEKTDITFGTMVESISTSLPTPNTAVYNAQKESYDVFSDLLEVVIDNYISEDAVSGLATGDYVEGAMEGVRVSIMAYFKRQYLANQNMLPELEEFFSNTEGSAKERIGDHNERVMGILTDMLTDYMKDEHRVDKRIVKTEDKIAASDEEPAPDDNADTAPVTDTTGDTPPVDDGTTI